MLNFACYSKRKNERKKTRKDSNLNNLEKYSQIHFYKFNILLFIVQEINLYEQKHYSKTLLEFIQIFVE